MLDMLARHKTHVHPIDVATGPAEIPSGSYVRLIIPDSHGEHIDWGFANAMIRDVERLAYDIREVVWLGDQTDCGGTFNSHQRNYTHEMTESYEADIRAASRLYVMVRERTPFANHYALEGNHEQHVERFLARTFQRYADAELLLDRISPRALCHLDELDIRWIAASEFHQGLSVRGTIKLGRCFFTHGFSFAKNADSVHLAKVGSNIVFGHVHRAMSRIVRSVESSGFGAWCPGTLAKLQPLYRHTDPTDWSGGYALQFVEDGGNFTHINVPLFGAGVSGLAPLLKRMRF